MKAKEVPVAAAGGSPTDKQERRGAAQPPIDPVRLSAWRAVSKVRDTVGSALASAMNQHAGLPVEWYEGLLHLQQAPNGRLRQTEVEAAAAIGSTGVSRMLSKMQHAGLITRTTSAADRRALDVEITPLGEQRLARTTPIYMDSVQQNFGRRLDNEEASVIARILHRVADRTEAEADDSGNDRLVPFGETVLAGTSGAVAASDAIEIRNALEPLVLAQAARDLTPQGEAEMRSIVGRMSNCLDRPEEFFRTDWQLHRVIARQCQNVSLTTIYVSLVDVVEAHLESVVPTVNLAEYLSKRLVVHARLVDAVCSRDADRVRQAADEHHFTPPRPRALVDMSRPEQEALGRQARQA